MPRPKPATAKKRSPRRPKRPRPDELIAQIRDALDALRLPIMREELDASLGADDAAESRLEFLWRLLEPQLRTRRERSIERRVRAARFPAFKTLDNFDFDFQPDLDRDYILELATLDFIRHGQNILIGGMSGTGKSHIAIALGHLACAAGFRTRYTTNADLLAALHASLATKTLDEALRPYLRCDLLLIDEVGLDLPERTEVKDAQLFYKVIAPRYEAPRSTIITSNIDWELWGQHLGDDIATVAILDRLVHHGHAVVIEGPSWRAHEHEQLNAKRTKLAPKQSASKKTKRGTKPRSKRQSRN